ncbi:hypothetical protein AVEN_41868-1 [Araneus ventricosus]|uniref:Uncharacterized protein n=1 Tax=Araneus ventricosus TaxID=182803 RepID=A0A4Y2AC98_ARAVE|nr:hypothetical protein AVEN_41868-1 [Araneus ventricosus]
MTRTTPELTPLSKSSHQSSGRRFDSLRMIYLQQARYSTDLQWDRVSNVEISRPGSRNLTTRPSRSRRSYERYRRDDGRGYSPHLHPPTDPLLQKKPQWFNNIEVKELRWPRDMCVFIVMLFKSSLRQV